MVDTQSDRTNKSPNPTDTVEPPFQQLTPAISPIQELEQLPSDEDGQAVQNLAAALTIVSDIHDRATGGFFEPPKPEDIKQKDTDTFLAIEEGRLSEEVMKHLTRERMKEPTRSRPLQLGVWSIKALIDVVANSVKHTRAGAGWKQEGLFPRHEINQEKHDRLILEDNMDIIRKQMLELPEVPHHHDHLIGLSKDRLLPYFADILNKPEEMIFHRELRATLGDEKLDRLISNAENRPKSEIIQMLILQSKLYLSTEPTEVEKNLSNVSIDDLIRDLPPGSTLQNALKIAQKEINPFKYREQLSPIDSVTNSEQVLEENKWRYALDTALDDHAIVASLINRRNYWRIFTDINFGVRQVMDAIHGKVHRLVGKERNIKGIAQVLTYDCGATRPNLLTEPSQYTTNKPRIASTIIRAFLESNRNDPHEWIVGDELIGKELANYGVSKAYTSHNRSLRFDLRGEHIGPTEALIPNHEMAVVSYHPEKGRMVKIFDDRNIDAAEELYSAGFERGYESPDEKMLRIWLDSKADNNKFWKDWEKEVNKAKTRYSAISTPEGYILLPQFESQLQQLMYKNLNTQVDAELRFIWEQTAEEDPDVIDRLDMSKFGFDEVGEEGKRELILLSKYEQQLQTLMAGKDKNMDIDPVLRTLWEQLPATGLSVQQRAVQVREQWVQNAFSNAKAEVVRQRFTKMYDTYRSANPSTLAHVASIPVLFLPEHPINLPQYALQSGQEQTNKEAVELRNDLPTNAMIIKVNLDENGHCYIGSSHLHDKGDGVEGNQYINQVTRRLTQAFSPDHAPIILSKDLIDTRHIFPDQSVLSKEIPYTPIQAYAEGTKFTNFCLEMKKRVDRLKTTTNVSTGEPLIEKKSALSNPAMIAELYVIHKYRNLLRTAAAGSTILDTSLIDQGEPVGALLRDKDIRKDLELYPFTEGFDLEVFQQMSTDQQDQYLIALSKKIVDAKQKSSMQVIRDASQNFQIPKALRAVNRFAEILYKAYKVRSNPWMISIYPLPTERAIQRGSRQLQTSGPAGNYTHENVVTIIPYAITEPDPLHPEQGNRVNFSIRVKCRDNTAGFKFAELLRDEIEHFDFDIAKIKI